MALVLALLAFARSSIADPGSFERGRSTHFLLLYDVEFEHRTGRAGSARFERRVLQSLEDSYRALDQLLGIAPRRRIDVVVHDAGRFDRELAWRFRFPSAGFFGERVHVRGMPRFDTRLETVLAHELVHAALDQQAPSLRLPGWVNEGIATWFEGYRVGKRRLSPYERGVLTAAGRRGAWLDLARLSTPTFGSFDSAEAQRAYLQSYAMVDHLVARRGERTLRDWVRRLLRTGDAENALRRVARFDADELDRSLRHSLGL